MERNTILAVILSAIVIAVGLSIQATFFPPEPVDPPPEVTVEEEIAEVDEPEERRVDYTEIDHFSLVPLEDDPPEEEVVIDNEVFKATFSNRGAILKSLKLVEHLDDGEPVEAIFTGVENQGAFYMYLGQQYENPITETFHVRKIDSLTVEFYRDFSYLDGEGEVHDDNFTITKRFTFKPREYLFEVTVNIKNSNRGAPPLNFDGFAYTMGFEPQLGPEFFDLDGRYNYRNFYTFAGGNKESIRMNNETYTSDDFLLWTSLAGKYFTVIGIPDATRYRTTLIEGEASGLPQASKIMYSRPMLRSSDTTDRFRFYIGPQQSNVMTAYNRAADNEWGLSDLHLEEAIDESTWFGWLENILKFFLNLFYRLVPNYGVAIILLTIFIKVVLYPLTKKSLESSAKMQRLNPQIQEIREKHKGDTQKINQEMAELYKREKINPLGMGCFPMLLQFPIFIALYGLLNKHFELRGAVFIPGWITDLSAPDSIISFAPAQIPLIGWSDIRLLPIIYLGTMILSFKTTQAGAAGSAGQMKMMTTVMPLVLFFVLYNAPSGLLLYWTVMNLLTMLQQKYIAKKKQSQGEEQNVPEKKLSAPKAKSGKGKKISSNKRSKSIPKHIRKR